MTTVCLLILTFGVAHLGKVLIEDRFQGKRTGRIAAPKLRWVLGLGLGPVAVSAALLVGVEATASAAAVDLARHHPGARVLFASAVVPDGADYYPPLTRVKKDVAASYENGCHASQEASTAKACEYGSKDGELHIVLVGDSHATNWVPALEAVANARSWRVTVFTKSACALLDQTIVEGGKPYESCIDWGKDVLRQIAELSPDVTIMTQRRGARLWQADGRPSSAEAMTDALVAFWRSLDAGRLMVIRDTPSLPFDPPECVATGADCTVPAREALGEDPLVDAASMVPQVELIDMTDAFCRDGSCPPIIGNVLVWRDKHHFTATYSASLADALGNRIAAALDYARPNSSSMRMMSSSPR